MTEKISKSDRVSILQSEILVIKTCEIATFSLLTACFLLVAIFILQGTFHFKFKIADNLYSSYTGYIEVAVTSFVELVKIKEKEEIPMNQSHILF
jgi:hypothetical protein